jgi:hypothetical protein
MTETANLRIVPGDGPDFYPTPAWAVRGLLSVETFTGTICEPCCGAGHISKALEIAGYRVVSSDLYNYGYGISGRDARSLSKAVNVVTNPPYNLATEMLPHLLSVTERRVALLTRMAFLESKVRFLIFNKFRPARVHVFSERLSMAPSGKDVKGGGTVSHCWIVWDRENKGSTVLDWITPGFKTKGLL